MDNQPHKKDPGELEWLKNVRILFDNAKRRDPPVIYRSEIDSLLIGFRAIPRLSLTTQELVKDLEEKSAKLKRTGKKFLKLKL